MQHAINHAFKPRAGGLGQNSSHCPHFVARHEASDQVIRLRVLGSVELHDAGGHELRAILAQPKRLALLVYLAAGSPAYSRRDTLLALFWPEQDHEHARGALNQAIRFLRKHLGTAAAPAIVSRGDEEIGVDPAVLWCDAFAFRAAVSEHRNAEAMELYRGHFLDGFFAGDVGGFEEWMERERAQLRASAATAAQQLSEECEREQSYTDAVAKARQAVELSAPNERVVRNLLMLLDRLGDRSGAIHAYESFARRLAAEFDDHPSTETLATIARIRARVSPPDGSGVVEPVQRPVTASAMPGGTLARWRIERELGHGGMSTVYLARDIKHDRHVALKVMRHTSPFTADGAERFLREVEFTARLAHPHILPLIDSGVANGELYLVTPYVPGESLRARLRREPPLSAADALRIATEIAEALDYAHRAGVAHRDIKPENILLADGHAVVADFGVARALRASGATQDVAFSDAGTKEDICAFGAVLFEMLERRLAGDAENVAATLHARRDLDPAIVSLVASCLSFDVTQRPDSAGHVLRALEHSRMRTSEFPRVVMPAPRRRLATRMSVGGLAIAASWYAWISLQAPSLVHGSIAVMPFNIVAPDSSYSYLREGAQDVFNAQLNGEGVPRAVDTRAVLSAWRDAARRNGGDVTARDAIELAERRLGAELVLTGELVATRERATITARVLRVPSGTIVAEHSESGMGDPLLLTTRLATRLLAKSVGESSTRLSALSDSVGAVKEYLVGLRDVRAGNSSMAFDHFGRALEIDPTFAPAALWRAYVAWGAFVFGQPETRKADSVAWALRGRLGYRDSLILASLPSIGPRFPEPATAAEHANAWERAARANPDRPEVWAAWSNHLIAWGSQAGIPSHLELAAMAADSAIAVDSAFVPAYSHLTYVALLQRDTAGMRRGLAAWTRADSNGSPSVQWAVARALGDTMRANALFARMVATPARGVSRLNLELWSAYYGIASVADADRMTELQYARRDLSPTQRVSLAIGRARIASLRGRVHRALMLADSLRIDAPAGNTMRLALAESAFVHAGVQAARRMEAQLDTLRDPATRANVLCYTRMWRARNGDTLDLRRAAAEMRRLVRPLGPAQGWRVGNFDLCALLLEAWLDRRPGGAWTSAPLERLERVLMGGALTELPGNIAYLIVARWREEQGDARRALAVIRRRDPMSMQVVHPASWFLEGRLAIAAGDTAGAVYAYRRYLEIRDMPDPGMMTDDVRVARRQLARLVAARHGVRRAPR